MDVFEETNMAAGEMENLNTHEEIMSGNRVKRSPGNNRMLKECKGRCQKRSGRSKKKCMKSCKQQGDRPTGQQQQGIHGSNGHGNGPFGR